jgi:hypothetical protein
MGDHVMTKGNKAATQGNDHASETQTSSKEKQSRNIKSHGGKRSGAGRPVGSLNKLSRPLREAAALESEACLQTLIHLRDHSASEQVRLSAAEAILDRGHGRPRQEIDSNTTLNIILPPQIRPQHRDTPRAIPTGPINHQGDEERPRLISGTIEIRENE